MDNKNNCVSSLSLLSIIHHIATIIHHYYPSLSIIHYPLSIIHHLVYPLSIPLYIISHN